MRLKPVVPWLLGLAAVTATVLFALSDERESGLAGQVSGINGTNIYLYCGSNGYCPDTTALTAAMQSEGAGSVTSGNDADNLADYALVIVMVPRAAMDTPLIQKFTDYYNAGGHIMFVGEHSGFAQSANENFNQLSASVNAGMSIQGSETDCGCGQQTTNVNGTLGNGVASLKYACHSNVSGGDVISAFISQSCRLLVFTDVNAISPDDCSYDFSAPDQNLQLFKNVWSEFVKDPVCGTVPTSASSASASSASAAQCTAGQCCDIPNGVFKSDTVSCRAPAGACDVEEFCTGASAECPADDYFDNTQVCRAAAGACDFPETCTGDDPDCPGDVVRPNGIICPDDGNPCTADLCNGQAGVCNHNQVPDNTACFVNGAQGACIAGACQIGPCIGANGQFLGNNVVCRPAAGPCDVAENCPGNAAACPADAFTAANVQCRAAAGVCDVAENCPGNGPFCPNDGKKPGNFQCRPSSNIKQCDPAEFCAGGNFCPNDLNTCTELTLNVPPAVSLKAGNPIPADKGVLGIAAGGSPPYTFQITGLPERFTPGFTQYQYTVNGNTISGTMSVGAANGEITWWSRLVGQLGGQEPGKPDPDGRDYDVKVKVTDANGDSVTKDVDMTVEPIVADVQLSDGCACFEGTRNCDVHATNLGPDAVPQLEMESTTNNVTYKGDLMPPVVAAPGQPANQAAPANAQVNGNMVVWDNNGVAVQPGGELAAWPNLEAGDGEADRTATVDGQFNVDPNMGNNTVNAEFSNECEDKTVSPEGPVCKDDALLYVISIGGTGVNTVDFSDELHPCLDPATVTSLMPEQCQVQGNSVVCTGIPLSTQMPTAMISFTVKPKPECAVGTDITNTGTATFPQGGPNGQPITTATTTNRFCPCDDKSDSCGGNSSSKKSSSKGSSKASADTQTGSAGSGGSNGSNGSGGSNRSNASNGSNRSASSGSIGSSQRSGTSLQSSGRSSSAGSALSSARSSAFSASSLRSGSTSSGRSSSSSSILILTISSAQNSPFITLVPSSSARSSAGLSSSLPPSVCGNNTLELPEECDDGNLDDGDACSSVCLLEQGSCGDGVIQRLFNEQCEPSIASDIPCDGVSCRFFLESCGDGTLDPGETCDLGARNSNLPNASCRSDCSAARCGDRIVDPGEACDDGNRAGADGCTSLCQLERSAPEPENTLPAQIIDLPVIASCSNATECASNFCRNGQCAQCASNAECGSSQRCQSGRCEIAACQSDAQCESGQFCLNGRCEVAACTMDAQCPAGQRCLRGGCVPLQIAGGPCVLDAQCAPGLRCYNGTCTLPVTNTLPATVTPPVTAAPETTDSGPEALVLMAAGAAAGYAWIRRRR